MKMASETEDAELAALRLAVLQSVKRKEDTKPPSPKVEEDDELAALRAQALRTKKTQQIPVSTGVQPKPDIPKNNLHHGPPAFRRGRGRGVGGVVGLCGRGRGRQNLIVIQTIPLEEQSAPAEAKPSKAQPTSSLIRPQDKWSGVASNTQKMEEKPVTTKAPGKFSRFEDSNSDSDEDDDDDSLGEVDFELQLSEAEDRTDDERLPVKPEGEPSDPDIEDNQSKSADEDIDDIPAEEDRQEDSAVEDNGTALEADAALDVKPDHHQGEDCAEEDVQGVRNDTVLQDKTENFTEKDLSQVPIVQAKTKEFPLNCTEKDSKAVDRLELGAEDLDTKHNGHVSESETEKNNNDQKTVSKAQISERATRCVKTDSSTDNVKPENLSSVPYKLRVISPSPSSSSSSSSSSSGSSDNSSDSSSSSSVSSSSSCDSSSEEDEDTSQSSVKSAPKSISHNKTDNLNESIKVKTNENRNLPLHISKQGHDAVTSQSRRAVTTGHADVMKCRQKRRSDSENNSLPKRLKTEDSLRSRHSEKSLLTQGNSKLEIRQKKFSRKRELTEDDIQHSISLKNISRSKPNANPSKARSEWDSEESKRYKVYDKDDVESVSSFSSDSDDDKCRQKTTQERTKEDLVSETRKRELRQTLAKRHDMPLDYILDRRKNMPRDFSKRIDNKRRNRRRFRDDRMSRRWVSRESPETITEGVRSRSPVVKSLLGAVRHTPENFHEVRPDYRAAETDWTVTSFRSGSSRKRNVETNSFGQVTVQRSSERDLIRHKSTGSLNAFRGSLSKSCKSTGSNAGHKVRGQRSSEHESFIGESTRSVSSLRHASSGSYRSGSEADTDGRLDRSATKKQRIVFKPDDVVPEQQYQVKVKSSKRSKRKKEDVLKSRESSELGRKSPTINITFNKEPDLQYNKRESVHARLGRSRRKEEEIGTKSKGSKKRKSHNSRKREQSAPSRDVDLRSYIRGPPEVDNEFSDDSEVPSRKKSKVKHRIQSNHVDHHRKTESKRDVSPPATPALDVSVDRSEYKDEIEKLPVKKHRKLKKPTESFECELDDKIRKIKQKNYKIMMRNREIEKDKQKYG